jgi:hypothetical protein
LQGGGRTHSLTHIWSRFRDKLSLLRSLVLDVKRQSDRDFPRGSMRNGIIDDTKCQAEERKGNLFLLLCIGSTVLGGEKLQSALRYDSRKWKKWLQFIKLYLSMEQWFHDSNPKEEVNNARPLIAKVLRSLKDLFPREGTGNEYNIPKFHAMTKMQFYVKRYGSAKNFYGGTGESAHKFFVKAPGQKTQRRITEFASQVANQYYNMLVTTKARRSLDTYDKSIQTRGHHGVQHHSCDTPTLDEGNHNDEIQFLLSGKYSVQITKRLTEKASRGEDIYPQWKTNLHGVKNNNYKFRLHPRLISCIVNSVNTIEDISASSDADACYRVVGFTRLTTTSQDGNQVVYHANPYLQGRMWYDWAYVHFEETTTNGNILERFYPAKILGFVTIENTTEAIIHCTEKPLDWSRVQKEFVVNVNLGKDYPFVHPLCVISLSG